MSLLTYNPRLPLAYFVDCFWLHEGCPAHAMERVLPTGTMQLIISLGDESLRVFDQQTATKLTGYGNSLLCGAHSQFSIIDTAQQVALIGVHFRPGGASPFIDIPAGELHNSHVSLENIYGSYAQELRERLLEEREPAGKFQVLERFLLEQLVRATPSQPAVTFALNQFLRLQQGLKVADVIERTGFTARRFIEMFTDEVGLTPKLYSRVQRFQAVLRLLSRAESIDWADAALTCGYYDQSHFNNDFRSFSGMSPTKYVGLRSEYANHVRIID